MRLAKAQSMDAIAAAAPAREGSGFWIMMKPLLLLAKPGIVMAELLAGLAGALLASPSPAPGLLLPAMLCIAMAASGAAMINGLMEEEPDRMMPRLAKRSCALETAGRDLVRKTAVLLLAAATLISTACLPSKVIILLAAAVIGYTLVYTALLKHRTPWSVLAGGIPGALPPIIAALAVSNSIPAASLFLGLVIYLWQLPHFWFLALHCGEEYRLAGIPALPLTHGIRTTKRLIMSACAPLLVSVVLCSFSAGHRPLFTAILAGAYCYFVFLSYCYLYRSMDYRRGFTASIVLMNGTLLAVIGNTLLNAAG